MASQTEIKNALDGLNLTSTDMQRLDLAVAETKAEIDTNEVVFHVGVRGTSAVLAEFTELVQEFRTTYAASIISYSEDR